MSSQDFEKAKSSETWPYRVGVRMFKHFSTRPRTNNGQSSQGDARRQSWNKQAGVAQQDEPIVLNNKFNALVNHEDTMLN